MADEKFPEPLWVSVHGGTPEQKQRARAAIRVAMRQSGFSSRPPLRLVASAEKQDDHTQERRRT